MYMYMYECGKQLDYLIEATDYIPWFSDRIQELQLCHYQKGYLSSSRMAHISALL